MRQLWLTALAGEFPGAVRWKRNVNHDPGINPIIEFPGRKTGWVLTLPYFAFLKTFQHFRSSQYRCILYWHLLATQA
jgi:hypothetical protein